MAPRRIDLRHVDLSRSMALLFRSFDELGPGEELFLEGDQDPAALVRALELERTRQCECELLHSGPDGFRLGVRRRAATDDPADRLMAEHHRLDQLLARLESRLNQGLLTLARTIFHELDRELDRHLLFEERTVFPTFERVEADRDGCIAHLRAEQPIIRRLVREIGRNLPSTDALVLVAAVADLREVIGPHFSTEERQVLPVIARELRLADALPASANA